MHSAPSNSLYSLLYRFCWFITIPKLKPSFSAAVTSSPVFSGRAGVGVLVGSGIGVLVAVGIGVLVGTGVGVLVAVGTGVLVGAGVGVLVAVGAGVFVGAGVGVRVAVGIGVLVGAGVSVLVAVGAGVLVGTGVGVLVAVGIGVLVGAGVLVGISVGVTFFTPSVIVLAGTLLISSALFFVTPAHAENPHNKVRQAIAIIFFRNFILSSFPHTFLCLLHSMSLLYHFLALPAIQILLLFPCYDQTFHISGAYPTVACFPFFFCYILYQRKRILILTGFIEHYINASYRLAHTSEFTFADLFFTHINELKFDSAFFKISLSFFCIIALFCAEMSSFPGILCLISLKQSENHNNPYVN